MNFLIHLIQQIFAYPVINLLVFFYQSTHNFLLAIISLNALIQIFLAWPATIIMAFIDMKELEARSQATVAGWIMYPWRYRMLSVNTQIVLRMSATILSILQVYLTIGLYVFLLALGGISLNALNSALYSFVPHLSTQPDYTFTILGQTTSLVRRDFLPIFIAIIALSTLISAFIRADVLVRISDVRNRWCTLFSLFGQYFLQSLLQWLVVCWLFNAGIFLSLTVGGLLHIPATLANGKYERAKGFLKGWA